jgi:hypothetical protein
MRKLGFCFALVSLLGASGAAMAQTCHVEPIPSATLLLPYFEVDLNNPNSHTTLLSINNGSTQPVLAKVEVWSDLGVPIFGFMIYLKGDDIQSINLRDVIVSGLLPQTTPAPGTFPSCNGVLPPATISPGLVFDYDHALTGQSVGFLGGRCAGRNLHDNVARGYITVDTVSYCSTQFQGDPGAFASGGASFFTNQNVLWGDYFYQNSTVDQAEGHPLVHITADVTNSATSTPGRYTFYGKFVSWTAVDNRVPLATNFAARYANSYPIGSDIVVWRDSKVAQNPFICGSLPSWYPLGATSIIAFDEDDHSTALPTTAFPAVAQRVTVGSSALPSPYPFGWLFLDLNTTVAAGGNNPPVDPRADQAWVTVTQSFLNGQQAGLGYEAIRFDNACNARHTGL